MKGNRRRAQPERNGQFHGLVWALEDASADGATKARAAWALGILANGNAADSAAIAAAGAIPLLVELLSGGLDEGRANAAALTTSKACKVGTTECDGWLAVSVPNGIDGLAKSGGWEACYAWAASWSILKTPIDGKREQYTQPPSILIMINMYANTYVHVHASQSYG
jgi:hypothetical protein